MIVIDVGNTETVIGFYKKKKLIKIDRFITKEKNLKKKLIYFLHKNKVINIKSKNKICIIASVVPKINKSIFSLFKDHNFNTLNINIRNTNKILISKYLAPQLGADRIANSVAAIKKYGKDSIVIDFGTATTFDVIKNKIYEGGSIAPGINISHDALVNNASKLKKISIKKIKSVVGVNTRESMQSGFYWGYIGLINEIINRIIIEKNFQPKIILTGGLAKIFRNEINFKNYHEPNLTLDGLYHIGILYYA